MHNLIFAFKKVTSNTRKEKIKRIKLLKAKNNCKKSCCKFKNY